MNEGINSCKAALLISYVTNPRHASLSQTSILSTTQEEVMKNKVKNTKWIKNKAKGI